jgi:hypothetical protein
MHKLVLSIKIMSIVNSMKKDNQNLCLKIIILRKIPIVLAKIIDQLTFLIKKN